MAFPTADGWAVALTYGPDGDWTRNVRAAGEAALVVSRRRVQVDQPRLTEHTTAAVPKFVRRALDVIDVHTFLELRASGGVTRIAGGSGVRSRCRAR